MQRNKRLILIIFQVFAGILVACTAQIDCQDSNDCHSSVEQQSLFNAESAEDKKQFSPWAGKRADQAFPVYDEAPSDETSPENSAEVKRSFSPWAGKRNTQASVGYVVRARNTQSDRKKTRFHPWHGKRSGMAVSSGIPESILKQLVLEYIDLAEEKNSDKRGFSPWAGK